LGGTTVVTDSAGDDVGAARYGPYGTTIGRRGVPAVTGFTGAETEPDADLGIIHVGARYYAPDIGRWISADRFIGESPEKMVDSVFESNLYSYAANNPIGFIDPRGREATAVEKVQRWFTRVFGPRLRETKEPPMAREQGPHVVTPSLRATAASEVENRMSVEARTKLRDWYEGFDRIVHEHTICYGHDTQRDPPAKWANRSFQRGDQTCEDLFSSDLKWKGEDIVRDYIHTSLTQQQYDALVTWAGSRQSLPTSTGGTSVLRSRCGGAGTRARRMVPGSTLLRGVASSRPSCSRRATS
jgi:RHS repeat-associated protein